MGKSLFLLVCVALVVMLAATASAAKFQVGVSPSIIDLGEVEKGDSSVASFNILTPSEDSFMVEMRKDMGGIEFFDKKKYQEYIDEYSEQQSLEWIDFITNPVYLDTPLEGSGMRKAETIKFLVKVPEDAEPGYHVYQVAPHPVVSAGGGTGVSVVAVAKLEVLLKVPGQAIRDAEVLEVLGRTEGSRTRFDVYVQNTGTVTLTARGDLVKIFNLTGHLVGEIKTNQQRVGPGEVAVLKGLINAPLQGDYKVVSTVSYYSGETESEHLVSVSRSAAGTTGKVAEAAVAFPWWIAIIIIIIISYGIYRWI
jgi:hypothetical protein